MSRLPRVATAEPRTLPLREGVFHLVAADSDVASPYRGYVTVCGEPVRAESLPSCFPEDDEAGLFLRYCPACVREAVRWVAGEPTGGEPSGDVDLSHDVGLRREQRP